MNMINMYLRYDTFFIRYNTYRMICIVDLAILTTMPTRLKHQQQLFIVL